MTETFCEKNRRRALRRHCLKRAKARALAIARLAWIRCSLWPSSEADFAEMRSRDVLRRHRNRANCSCAMCCNPRRSPIEKQHLTLAEQKAAVYFKEQMLELFKAAAAAGQTAFESTSVCHSTSGSWWSLGDSNP
jgi:hypothetical protein